MKETFDIILCNINKNVLLEHMKYLSHRLGGSGRMLLSGFYTHDTPEVRDMAQNCSLVEYGRYERDNWSALLTGF